MGSSDGVPAASANRMVNVFGEAMSRCSDCRSFGLCAADCPIAPWNQEPASYPAPSRFAYLVRQRRWCGSPVSITDIIFISYPHRIYQTTEGGPPWQPIACFL